MGASSINNKCKDCFTSTRAFMRFLRLEFLLLVFCSASFATDLITERRPDIHSGKLNCHFESYDDSIASIFVTLLPSFFFFFGKKRYLKIFWKWLNRFNFDLCNFRNFMKNKLYNIYIFTIIKNMWSQDTIFFPVYWLRIVFYFIKVFKNDIILQL